LLPGHEATLIPCNSESFVYKICAKSSQITIGLCAFSGRHRKRDTLTQHAHSGEQPGCAFETSAERIHFREYSERLGDVTFVSQFAADRETRFQHLIRTTWVSVQHG
jgi:hypothetical protein